MIAPTRSARREATTVPCPFDSTEELNQVVALASALPADGKDPQRLVCERCKEPLGEALFNSRAAAVGQFQTTVRFYGNDGALLAVGTRPVSVAVQYGRIEWKCGGCGFVTRKFFGG